MFIVLDRMGTAKSGWNQSPTQDVYLKPAFSSKLYVINKNIAVFVLQY